MDYLVITQKNLKSAIAKATAVLRESGIVVYPTDTLYGLGCDALNEEAIRRVFAAKKRQEDKPLSIAVTGLGMMERYAHVTPEAKSLAEKFLPGALTLILRKRDLPDVLTSNQEKVAIRVPDNEVALGLIESLGRPITATSANLSGMKPPITPQEAMRQVEADLILDGGKLESRVPSTIVDLSGRPRPLRKGRIKWDDIERVISA
ncbi:MAG: L-threonylcarbamoyladenylate synthase [Candidatus Hydrothermarchaeaceae archaeon]